MRSSIARLALLLFAAATAFAATSEPPTLLACRAIADGALRLSCYDAAVDALLPAAVPARDTPSSVPEAAAAPAVASVTGETIFGKVDSTDTAVIQKVFGVATVDSIESTIVEDRATPDGKKVFVLANSQVWAQTDNANLSLGVGDAVRIRRGAVGSFLLAGGTTKKSMRVKRIG